MVRLFIILAAILTSCSAQKRLNRICKKNPDLCRYDTNYIDTFITHTKVIDSSFVTRLQDTILIERYGVRTQIVRSYDTLQIDQHKTDTLINREIVRTYTVQEKSKVPLWLKWVIVGVIAFMVLRVLGAYFDSKA